MNWYVLASKVQPVSPNSGVSYQNFLNKNHEERDWTNEKPKDEKEKKKSKEPGKGENVDVLASRTGGLTKTAGILQGTRERTGSCSTCCRK